MCVFLCHGWRVARQRCSSYFFSSSSLSFHLDSLAIEIVNYPSYSPPGCSVLFSFSVFLFYISHKSYPLPSRHINNKPTSIYTLYQSIHNLLLIFLSFK